VLFSMMVPYRDVFLHYNKALFHKASDIPLIFKGLGIIICLILLAYTSVTWAGERTIPYRVVGTYPHDPEAFTQGLVYERGLFYESTGLYGRSTLRIVEAKSGRIRRMVRLPDDWFGEGVALIKHKILQLTWRNFLGIVYEKGRYVRSGSFLAPTRDGG